jgi:hypothetical protein
MKKKELEQRLELMAAKIDQVPQENWGAIVEKFRELEAKIGRIESLERNHGFLDTKVFSLKEELSGFDRKLDNFKIRLSTLERRFKEGKPLVEVFKEEDVKKSHR